ncbi:MAG: hypothetical protein ABWX73_14560, partial [Marmoricola sp.]
FSDVVRETEPFATAQEAMRSLLFLEDQVASVGPRIEQGVVHAAPPAAARTDFAFLEIAEPASDQTTRGVLEALGFTPAGRHRSKPVTWWRNGDAHVVVNSGRHPDATAVPRATALGLMAPPVAAVADRAAALLWPEVNTSRGADEAMLPGITSPSGLHVFISDTPGHQDHWQRDFEPVVQHRTDDVWAGLDHVALSVSPYELNEEMAFFRTLFGLAPGPPEEFMEPRGRLLSRALRPTVGDLRVVLNVTEAPAQVAQPSGVTQAAFRCHDVAAVVTDLRSRGVPMMPVPENYYVDLDARFGLDPDLLDHLRGHQLMYDRVGGGELLHAYTRPLATHFYVEVLERRGGYDGYGSANTFVRLAAQAGDEAPASD